MNHIFLTGLIGSIILVLGSAWPDVKKISHPAKSIKNWLFTFGNILMFTYAFLGYLETGSIFFVILEILIVIATLMMMFNSPEKYSNPIIIFGTLALILWSLSLFEGYATIIFIIGLGILGIGYASKTGSQKRYLALTAGSILITIFSYMQIDWVFFWLNLFFALFSSYYLFKGLSKKHV